MRPPQPPAEAPPAAADPACEEPATLAQKPATDAPATTPRRLSDDNAATLRASYNLRYPDTPLTRPYPFYLGEPPVGAVVIRYGEGYFLKE